jgi:PAS domain S-box-containing protein
MIPPNQAFEILVVDDEPAHQEAIRRSLVSAAPGCRVRQAASLREYQEAVARQTPDLAILDLMLPDGRADSVLVSPPERGGFPRILMTSHGDEQVAVAALKAGAFDYLVKSPAAFADMPYVVQRALRAWGVLVERERALERLQESEQRFRDLVFTTADWVWEVDAEGRFVYVSDSVRHLLGYAPEEILGRTPFDLMPPPEAERVRALFREICSRREPFYELEDTVLHRDGSPRYHSASGVPILDRDGTLLGYRGTDTDVTSRRRTETALRESETRFRQIAEHLGEWIWEIDADGVFTYSSPVVERILGYRAEDVVGKQRFASLFPPDERDASASRVLASMRGGLPFRGFQTRTLREDGKVVLLETGGTPLVDGLGRAGGYRGVSRDITEQKQMESQFLRAQRLESVGALASGIAHDLNNILSPILMSTPMLRETLTDAEGRDLIDTVECCARRGADITRQLLTFARGTPGVRVPVPVRHLLREMETIIRETFPRDIRPRIEVATDLWPVQGDSTQLHQALMNLCLNSRDAMPEGGSLRMEASNIEVDSAFAAMSPGASVGPHVRLVVADTGSGISPENLDRIFDPFFTTKEVGKGTGLGLASVMGIVRGHDGFVRVASQVGEGTTFELYFPASIRPVDAVRLETLQPPPRGGGELVLVVDDEAAVRDVIHRTLRAHGYRVLLANQGAEALGIYSQHRDHVRLVLTDMMMPVMGGPAVVLALQHMAPGLPVLGMTGLPERAGVKGLDKLELAQLLIKPFSGDELIRAVQQAIHPAASRDGSALAASADGSNGAGRP